MSARDYIPLKVELAAALLQIPVLYADGSVGPIVDHETAKQMTPDQVRSLFHRDHYPVRKVDGGPDAHWNIIWRPVMQHRHKTALIDKPQIAKSDRIMASEAAFRLRMLARAGQASASPRPKSRWPKRKFPKRQNTGGRR